MGFRLWTLERSGAGSLSNLLCVSPRGLCGSGCLLGSFGSFSGYSDAGRTAQQPGELRWVGPGPHRPPCHGSELSRCCRKEKAWESGVSARHTPDSIQECSSFRCCRFSVRLFIWGRQLPMALEPGGDALWLRSETLILWPAPGYVPRV